MGGSAGPKNAPGAGRDQPAGSVGGTTRPLASTNGSLGFRERLRTASFASEAGGVGTPQAPKYRPHVHDRSLTKGAALLAIIGWIDPGGRFDTARRNRRVHGNSWLCPAGWVRG